MYLPYIWILSTQHLGGSQAFPVRGEEKEKEVEGVGVVVEGVVEEERSGVREDGNEKVGQGVV
jgi:hypothetical protein